MYRNCLDWLIFGYVCYLGPGLNLTEPTSNIFINLFYDSMPLFYFTYDNEYYLCVNSKSQVNEKSGKSLLQKTLLFHRQYTFCKHVSRYITEFMLDCYFFNIQILWHYVWVMTYLQISRNSLRMERKYLYE